MIDTETYYIKKMDKPISFINKIIGLKVDNDRNILLYGNLEKNSYINKILKKLEKKEIYNIVLEKKLQEREKLICALNANQKKIFDGRWLEKYISIEILDYIINKMMVKKEEKEIAILTNEITDLSIETIKILAKQYKKTTVVSNNINKLKRIEREMYEKEGILIILSNNLKKSLQKSELILNIDFCSEVLNKYKIYEKAVILNLEGSVKIDNKRFEGISINNYEINVEREELIWKSDKDLYYNKDLLEAALYTKDTFHNIRNKIKKQKISVKELYGVNGKIERFY